MASATASSNTSTAASGGQGIDDNYTASQGAEAGTAEAQGRSDASAGTSGIPPKGHRPPLPRRLPTTAAWLNPCLSLRFLFSLAASSTLLLSGIPLIGIQPAVAAPVQCPDTWTGNKCEYYKDGYKAGKTDRKAGLSMPYERHAGAYYTQNASYYQAGYEESWGSK